ncbi:MarR family transcriptional regulator [Streptomyces sp. N2-109]|uniref:MarR family transcriptional regulator n=1 Tax=Streptomyces gossypii TaxID=2883101 RepID=A0ABT2K3I7_9ACTN|nr:MarR family transcriptional regulator [Streptomyces gossypii]MCT2594727.1 MarR family transcriptional regulator [Streptomyces gossypii]
MTTKSHLPQPPGTAQLLARQTVQLAAVMDAAAEKAAAASGLTRADVDVLHSLHQARGRLTPSELAAACRLSSGGTSNIVRRLAASGYLIREANSTDGRSSWVQLTEEGSRLAQTVTDAVDAGHERLLQRLPDGLAEQLSRLLGDALTQLER